MIVGPRATRELDAGEEARVLAEMLAKGHVRHLAVMHPASSVAGLLMSTLHACLESWVAGGQLVRVDVYGGRLVARRGDDTCSVARLVPPGDDVVEVLADAAWLRDPTDEDIARARAVVRRRPAGGGAT